MVLAALIGIATKSAAIASGAAVTAGKVAGATLATGTKLATSPQITEFLQKGQKLQETYQQVQDIIEQVEDISHSLETYSTEKIGEQTMEIKTATGEHRSVSSVGLAATGVALGGLALLGQAGGGLPFVGNLFGGYGRGFNGYGCAAGGFPAPALGQVDITIGMASQIATLSAERYAEREDDKIWKKLAEVDKETALNRQASEFLFKIANDKIDCNQKEIYGYVNCHFVRNKKVLPSREICGGITGDGYTMNLPTTAQGSFGCDCCCPVPVSTPAPTPSVG